MRESLREQAAEMIEQYTQPSAKKEEPDCPPKDLKASPSQANSEDEKPASSSSKSAVSSYSLTPTQIERIKNLFADDISQGIEPRKKRVVALMKTELSLRSIVHSQPHVKKVIDRVRYLYQHWETTDPYELPEESASVRTAAYEERRVPPLTPKSRMNSSTLGRS